MFPSVTGSDVYCPDGSSNDDPVICQRGLRDVIYQEDPDDFDDFSGPLGLDLLGRSLEKRAGNKEICASDLKIKGARKMIRTMPGYPSTSNLLAMYPNVATYPPLDVDNCNDFRIGRIATPTNGIPLLDNGQTALDGKPYLSMCS